MVLMGLKADHLSIDKQDQEVELGPFEKQLH